MITIKCDKRNAQSERLELLTSGSAGIQVRFEFSPEWEGLNITPCFCCGDPNDPTQIRTVQLVGGECCVPQEVLETAGKAVWAGAYGYSADGRVIIPTVWTLMGICRHGVDPDAAPGTDPTLPVWAQIEAMIGDLDDLDTEEKSSLVAAINEIADGMLTQEDADERYLQLTQPGTNIPQGADLDDYTTPGVYRSGEPASLLHCPISIGLIQLVVKAASSSVSFIQLLYGGSGEFYMRNVGFIAGPWRRLDNAGLADVATSGDYNDLSNKPTLAAVATSGSYNDLDNKPTIPTVNNATLTIKQGGVTKGTFSANASADVEIDLDGGTDAEKENKAYYYDGVLPSGPTDITRSTLQFPYGMPPHDENNLVIDRKGSIGVVTDIKQFKATVLRLVEGAYTKAETDTLLEDKADSADLAGYATETYVDSAITAAIGDAIGGAY